MSERKTRTGRGVQHGAQRVGERRDDRHDEVVNDFEGDMDAVALYFKERIYATFTGLAILLVVESAGHPDAQHATLALLLGVLGIVVADIISHLAVHQHLPGGRDMRILLRIAGGALSTVIVPGILLILAWSGVLELEGAIRASVIVYLVTLGLVGWFAVRRSLLPWWKQLLVLAVLIVLALGAVFIQILAKSA